MAIYRPDRDLIMGNKAIKKLRGENGRLIKYVLDKKDEEIERLEKLIEEMREVFDGIKRFTQ